MKKRKSESNIFVKILLLILVLTILVVLYVNRKLIYNIVIQDNTTEFVLEKEKTIKNNKKNNEYINSVIENYSENAFGIDVSHYQGKIDWKNVKYINDTIPISFAIIRSTFGNENIDDKFLENWGNAKKISVIRGAYHYYRPNESSESQAKLFIENVILEEGDLPPILDIEKLSRRQTLKNLRKGLKKWLNIVEKHYGVKPIIYTGDKFYESFLSDIEFKEYYYWIANYNKISEPKSKNWLIWQFSEKGLINGISENVDLNVFNGNIKELQKLRIKNNKKAPNFVRFSLWK